MAGPQLALCMTKGVLPPIQTEKIQGTSSWLSELVQGVLVPGCQQNARYDFACRDDGGGSAEGRSEARKNGMGGMGHGTWDMGWDGLGRAVPRLRPYVCKVTGQHLMAYMQQARRAGAICSYADISLPGLARWQMRGTSSSVSLWGVWGESAWAGSGCRRRALALAPL